MNILLQMDIDLIERLAEPVRRGVVEGDKTYNERNLKEAENEVVRIVERIKVKYDTFEEYEKVIANQAIKKVQTYYKIKL